MPLPPDLLAILACPSPDHAPLELAGEELVCSCCASRFPIRDGIPVLLADDAVPGPNGLGVPAGAAQPPTRARSRPRGIGGDSE